jgi:hypothetical protein
MSAVHMGRDESDALVGVRHKVKFLCFVLFYRSDLDARLCDDISRECVCIRLWETPADKRTVCEDEDFALGRVRRLSRAPTWHPPRFRQWLRVVREEWPQSGKDKAFGRRKREHRLD